jgi:hypothetical protein
MKTGQVTAGTAIAGGLITAIVSLGTAYATSSMKTAVLEERQKLQYEELSGDLDEVKGDVKDILEIVNKL